MATARYGPATRLRLFGGVTVRGEHGDVDLGGPKQRAVLGVLALDAGRPVPDGRLIELVWGGEPPAQAASSLRAYVSKLRKALDDADLIVWRDGAYVLLMPVDQIDVHVFDQLVSAGLDAWHARDLSAARAHLDDALAMWTGPPLGSSADGPEVTDAVARFERRRRDAEETLLEVRLASGEHDHLVGDLTASVAAEPLSERRRVQLALALYRSGRAVEALRSIDEARRVLAEEVGVVPGPELVDLEQAILAHDPKLSWHPVERDVTLDPSLAPSLDPSPTKGEGVAFVGRVGELAQLADALGGTGSAVVVVAGEAGIGKSTLVTEALDPVAPGRPVAWGRCSEMATSAPLRPWAGIAAALDADVSDGSMDPSPDGPFAAALARHDRDGSPLSSRLLVHEGITEALRGLRRPVIVIDDVQWADEASLALLELLADDLAHLDVVVLVTLRTPLVDPAPALVDCLGTFARARGYRRIDLDGLDAAALVALVEQSASASGSRQLGAFLHERTNGNPFFARELLALLVAEGRTTEPDGADLATASLVPAAVQDVIRRRASRLPPASQVVLSTAAVLGTAFDADILARVADADTGAVLDALEPSVIAGFVDAVDTRPGRYRFSHALVGETFLAELNPLRRARLHAAATDAFLALRPDDDRSIDELAHHAYAGASAGTAEVAVGLTARAGARLAAAHAPREAAVQYRRALRALDLAAPRDRARRVQLLTDLGVVLGDAGDMAAARTALADAAALALDLGDAAAAASALARVNADDLWSSLDWAQYDGRTVELIDRALLGLGEHDVGARAELLAAKAAQLYYAQVPAEADALSAEAVATAARIGDPMTQARVLMQRFWSTWYPSGNGARTEAADALLELVERGSLPPSFTPLAHLARFTNAYERADGSLARAALSAARRTADPVRTPSAWTYLLYAEASVQLVEGAFDVVEATVVELIDALQRTRPFVVETTAAGLRAQLACDTGRTDDALAQLDVLARSIYGPSMPWFRAWVLAEGGRFEDARAQLRAFGGQLPDDWFRIVVLTAAVRAAAVAADVDFITARIDELRPLAGFVACAGSGGIVLGPVALALAEAEHALGNTDAARRYLAQAETEAQQLGARPSLVRSARLRDALDP